MERILSNETSIGLCYCKYLSDFSALTRRRPEFRSGADLHPEWPALSNPIADESVVHKNEIVAYAHRAKALPSQVSEG